MSRPRVESQEAVFRQLRAGPPKPPQLLTELFQASQLVDNLTSKYGPKKLKQHLSPDDFKNIDELIGPDNVRYFKSGIAINRLNEKLNQGLKIALKIFGIGLIRSNFAPVALGVSLILPDQVETAYGKPNRDKGQSNTRFTAKNVAGSLIENYEFDLQFLNPAEREAIMNMQEVISRSESFPNIPALLNTLSAFAILALSVQEPMLGGVFAGMNIIANAYYMNVMTRMKSWRHKYGAYSKSTRANLRSMSISGQRPSPNPATADALLAGREWFKLQPILRAQYFFTVLLPSILGIIVNGSSPESLYFALNLFSSMQMITGNIDLTDYADTMFDIADLSSGLSKLVEQNMSLSAPHQLENFLKKQKKLSFSKISLKENNQSYTVSYPRFTVPLPRSEPYFEIYSPEPITLSKGAILMDGEERSGRSIALRALAFNIASQQEQQTVIFNKNNDQIALSRLGPDRLRKKFRYVKMEDDVQRPASYIFNEDSIFPIPTSNIDPLYKYQDILVRYHTKQPLTDAEFLFLEFARELILGETTEKVIAELNGSKTYAKMAQELANGSNINILTDRLIKNARKFSKLFDEEDIKEMSISGPFHLLGKKLQAKLLLIHNLRQPEKQKVVAIDEILDVLSDDDLQHAIEYMRQDVEQNSTTFILHTKEEHVRSVLLESGLVKSRIVCSPPNSNGQAILKVEDIK